LSSIICNEQAKAFNLTNDVRTYNRMQVCNWLAKDLIYWLIEYKFW
jgi:hypothetical protein